jgi:hypothetical protein
MLIIRVWREDGSFRAIVTTSTDIVVSAPSEYGGGSTPDQVVAVVRRWLQSV